MNNAIYDTIAKQYSLAYDSDASDKKFLRKLISKLSKKPHILDVGCGTGRTTNYYYKSGCDVVGVDLSTGMLSVARKNFPKIKFLKMDMKKLKFGKNSFDAISFAYSIFHLKKPEAKKVILKSRELLKEKGFILLIVQEGKGETIIKELLGKKASLYLKLYAEQELKDLLLSCGFETISVSRKKPHKYSLPYNKMCVIAKKI